MALALRLPPRAQAQAAPAAARGVARAAHGWRNAAAKPRSRCVARASRSFTRHDDGSGPAGDLAVHVYPTAEAQVRRQRKRARRNADTRRNPRRLQRCARSSSAAQPTPSRSAAPLRWLFLAAPC
jgi:hypothetical protein